MTTNETEPGFCMMCKLHRFVCECGGGARLESQTCDVPPRKKIDPRVLAKAAPDLLDACYVALEMLNGTEAAEQIHDAIVKAYGKAKRKAL